jgi:hypothetical protein
MLIVGCDFHTPFRQIAMANDESGELFLERRLVGASEKLLGRVARAPLPQSEVDCSNRGTVRTPRAPKTRVPKSGTRGTRRPPPPGGGDVCVSEEVKGVKEVRRPNCKQRLRLHSVFVNAGTRWFGRRQRPFLSGILNL